MKREDIPRREEISIIWSWEDIQTHDESLSKIDCERILYLMEKNHDCNVGINWDVIDNWIYFYKKKYGEMK